VTDDQAGIRQCGQCKEWLPTGEFKKNQNGYFYSSCRECTNSLARERYRSKQQEAGKSPRKVAPEDQDGRRMCRDCEQWLSLEDFSPSKHQKSGRASYCRLCMNRRNRDAAAAKAVEEGREIRAIRPRGPDDRDGERMCRDCEQWLPLEGFAPSSTRASGYGSYCQPCMNERTKASYAKRVFEEEGREVRKPEELPDGLKRCARCDEVKELAEFVKASRTVTGTHSYCKPCFNVVARESVIKIHGSTRNYHLIRRYDLTEVEVAAKIEEQGGMCAICGRRRPSFHVDHDHETGKVRGMLCFNCNNGLGHFKDNVEVMRAAIEYVIDHYGYHEDARYVPEDMIDPKGTWVYPEQQARGDDLWAILGNLEPPGPAGEGLERDSSTGRGSP